MTKEQAREIADSMDEAEVYEGYSGRGMYGAKCAGIVAPVGMGTIIGYLACEAGLEIDDLPNRCDNMGLKMIYY